MNLYQQNTHCQMPRFRPSENGDQLLVKGNYSGDTDEYLVTVFVYKTGVVLIQGKDFVKWTETDLKSVRSLVDEDQQAVDQSLNNSRPRQKTPQPRVTPIPPRKTQPKRDAPQPMVSTPAGTAVIDTPPDLNFSTDDSVSSVEARQTELKDLEVFCDMVQQLSDIEYDKVQGSRNNDTTENVTSDCEGCHVSSVIIQELNKEVARLEDQLQKTAASAILIAKLKDAEDSAKELLKRNKFLESQLTHPLSDVNVDDKIIPSANVTSSKDVQSSAKKTTNAAETRKTIHSKDNKMKNTDIMIDNKNTDNKPTRAIIISSSMGRGVAREVRTNNAGHIDCFGLVHPSAKADDLKKSAKDMLETDKPDVVTLMGGTNNLACGERPRAVISKIEHLVRVCQRASPSTKIVVSGLITRSDRPDLNSHIKTINAVLERNSRNKDFSFMDNTNIGFNNLIGDGLHLNYHGKIKLAKNIGGLISQAFPFHNGHQKIHV